ncbi:MAG: nitroreductase family protein [Bacteroidetes bacterium]|nr:nitroreductase family protein [Bacteroidia bacterium]PCH69747.1 MAG: nitroreductase family protein [Bacteroidota bacterium]
MVEEHSFISYSKESYSEDEMLKRSKDFYEWMDKRRTLREFSDKPIPKEVLGNIVKAASTAPSGANKQPWTFCIVTNPEIKSEIKKAAEKEEYENYHGRMSEEWVKDLQPFHTDWNKPFLEIAPALIIVFKRVYEEIDGNKKNNYYVNESVGLATGFLLSAIHNAGLVALTHTPSPMNFLSEVLKRPENERAFLLIPVGYPPDDAKVPDLKRKGLDEIAVYYD